MPKWSDGVERDPHFEQSALHLSIQAYFERRLEEDLIGLRWDNEYLNRMLREREEDEINAAIRMTKAAAA